MKKYWILSLSSLLVLLLGACSGNNVKSYKSVEEMVADAKASVTFISAQDFKKKVESGEKYYLIDCREAVEFDSVCIKGAINIPRTVLEAQVSDKAPKKRNTVYIYCNNADKAILAASVLPEFKYAHVKVIDGGLDAVKAKFPELIELNPVRDGAKSKAPTPASGGCGG